MDERDEALNKRREESKVQLNKILEKRGWKFETSKVVGVGVLQYRLVRTDGRVLDVRALLSDLLAFDLNNMFKSAADGNDPGINLVLALHLMSAADEENRKYPIEKSTCEKPEQT